MPFYFLYLVTTANIYGFELMSWFTNHSRHFLAGPVLNLKTLASCSLLTMQLLFGDAYHPSLSHILWVTSDHPQISTVQILDNLLSSTQ